MIQDDLSFGVRQYWNSSRSIPGVFEDIDFLIFDRLLTLQESTQTPGDLLEIGALLGKSAIVIGVHATGASRMLVCDVFDGETEDEANNLENAQSYAAMTRAAFEANYRHFVPRPPEIIQRLSAELPKHVAADSIRFAHVDGGHLYNTVQTDIQTVEALLNDEGIVAFDDYRAQHTPGVAAAVWNAVADGLVPICVTETKLYGSWSEPVADAAQAHLRAWFSQHAEVDHGTQIVAGRPLLLVANPQIWTLRRRVKAILPPIVVKQISRPRVPFLGA